MKYSVEKNAISIETANLLASYLVLAEQSRGLKVDSQVEGSSVVYGNELLDALMLSLHPHMESATKLSLLPTYSFARIYRRGDVLAKHRDRPACEVSATLTLGYVSDYKWPIFIEDLGTSRSISLDKGDMLIYKGCEVDHWRETFEGDLWIQVFLHYVDSNGPFKDHAFDKRDIAELYETVFDTFLRRD